MPLRLLSHRNYEGQILHWQEEMDAAVAVAVAVAVGVLLRPQESNAAVAVVLLLVRTRQRQGWWIPGASRHFR